MSKLPIAAFTKQMMTFAKVHATPISTGAVIIGMISAVVLAVKAGKETAEDIEELKEELETEELSVKEVIKVSWKHFIPVVLILGLSIGCLVVTTNKMMKRYAALSTAYALTENYMKDYMAATSETVGAKKEQNIRDKAIEKQVARHPVAERGIVETGHGDTLFYDAITTRYFRSSMENVKKAEKHLAGIYQAEDMLRFSEYTYALGIGANCEFGDSLGWKKSGRLDLTDEFAFLYSSGLAPDTGEPYVAIYHLNQLTDITL